VRVLFIPSPSATHMMPIVPLAQALRTAGHEVLVAGQPDIAATARGAGLPMLPVGDMFDAMELTQALPDGKRPIEAGVFQVQDGQWARLARAWVIHAKYLYGRYLELARAWRPNLLLTDPLEFSALIVGGLLGVPVVQHRWGPEPLSQAGLELSRRALHTRAVTLGLPAGLPDPDLVLDPFPACWSVPGVPPGEQIRAVPYNGGGRAPTWATEPPTGRRVCVSFGSVMFDLGGLSLVRHLMQAAAEISGIELVVTIGDRHRALLGPVPPMIRLVPPTPLHTFVGSCAAVVHHGGGGTALTALAHGVPQLLLPQMMDQFVRCERIAASGAGLSLPEAFTQNDPAALREALTEVIEKPGYLETARRLRDENAAQPSPADITARLAALAGQRV
jgi:UDP:flavonoid glycosyltransferase YjiC (YdhE family)